MGLILTHCRKHYVTVLCCFILLFVIGHTGNHGTTSMVVVVNALSSQQAKYYGGAGVGKFVINDRAANSNNIQCHYDMILVERIQGRPKTETGLFVPQQDLPRLHLCRVIAIGPGKEEENGIIIPVTGILVNDIIIAKNPWGIGPRDEETMDGKKLSYMRFQDVAAVLSGGLIPDDDDDNNE
jgi:co-chaperonin GroES (HSP10)